MIYVIQHKLAGCKPQFLTQTDEWVDYAENGAAWRHFADAYEVMLVHQSYNTGVGDMSVELVDCRGMMDDLVAL